jgi:serine/threonine protein kinase
MTEQLHRNALPQGFKLHEYKIESVLGKPGGFGITYLATDTHLRQLVAIKEYLPNDFAIREGVSTVLVKSSSEEASFQWGLKCFIEEARLLAKFNHKNIVKVLRFFEENGTAYMVMEYQNGKNLADYLKDKHILTEAELLKIVQPLLSGLKEVHKAGFLHRDIKPHNIFIREDNTPVLLDFGSARYAIGQKSRSVTSIVTPGYAPLEQYDNEIKDQGPWTDIYALGAVMYHAINGDAPPAATRRIMKDPMKSAVKLGKGQYKKNLLESIDWSLKLSEEDRPQTVEDWQKKMLDLTTMPTTPANSIKPYSKLLFISILVILFLSITIALIVNENILLNNQIYKERSARHKLEKQLKIEQQRHIETKINYEHAKTLISKIGEFNLQELDKQAGFNNKASYYDITNVEFDDRLNVREFPGRFNKAVGNIPSTENCIKFLGKYRLLGTQVWVRVKYKQIEGWVNSFYLVKNDKTCGIKY